MCYLMFSTKKELIDFILSYYFERKKSKKLPFLSKIYVAFLTTGWGGERRYLSSTCFLPNYLKSKLILPSLIVFSWWNEKVILFLWLLSNENIEPSFSMS